MKDNFVSVTTTAISFVGGVASVAVGGFDAMIYVLFMLIFVDFITGLLKAAKKRRFRLQAAIWGFWTKLFEVVAIAICVGLDNVFSTEPWLRNIAVIWYSVCEGASVLENMAALKVPLPEGLVKVLVQAKKGFGVSVVNIFKETIRKYLNSEEQAECEKEIGGKRK